MAYLNATRITDATLGPFGTLYARAAATDRRSRVFLRLHFGSEALMMFGLQYIIIWSTAPPLMNPSLNEVEVIFLINGEQ